MRASIPSSSARRSGEALTSQIAQQIQSTRTVENALQVAATRVGARGQCLPHRVIINRQRMVKISLERTGMKQTASDRPIDRGKTQLRLKNQDCPVVGFCPAHCYLEYSPYSVCLLVYRPPSWQAYVGFGAGIVAIAINLAAIRGEPAWAGTSTLEFYLSWRCP